MSRPRLMEEGVTKSLKLNGQVTTLPHSHRCGNVRDSRRRESRACNWELRKNVHSVAVSDCQRLAVCHQSLTKNLLLRNPIVYSDFLNVTLYLSHLSSL